MMSTRVQDEPDVGAGVYLAAVMEYMMAEALELGGNAARDERMTVLTSMHFGTAVKNDEEGLATFCRDVEFVHNASPPISRYPGYDYDIPHEYPDDPEWR